MFFHYKVCLPRQFFSQPHCGHRLKKKSKTSTAWCSPFFSVSPFLQLHSPFTTISDFLRTFAQNKFPFSSRSFCIALKQSQSLVEYFITSRVWPFELNVKSTPTIGHRAAAAAAVWAIEKNTLVKWKLNLRRADVNRCTNMVFISTPHDVKNILREVGRSGPRNKFPWKSKARESEPNERKSSSTRKVGFSASFFAYVPRFLTYWSLSDWKKL